MTEGNKYNRYIGITDEPLCEEGRKQLFDKNYKKPEKLFVSPMKRCIETAEILFPRKEYIIIDDLAECNFGEFENRNYKELAGNAAYQEWIDSNGRLSFPGGENPDEFKKRSIQAFEEVLSICSSNEIHYAAIVAHGGTIMSVMEAFSNEKKDYYQWHVKNGEGYYLEIDKKWVLR